MVLAGWIFAGALMKTATTLVAGDFCCGASCMWPGYLVQALVSLYVLMTLAMVVRFSTRFRTESWKPAPKWSGPKAVDDPLFRWWSRVRMSKLTVPLAPRTVSRMSGIWSRQPDEMIPS